MSRSLDSFNPQPERADRGKVAVEPEAALAPPRSGPSLKGRALRLQSTREHSRLELERKLADFAQSPDQLAQVLDDLQAKGLISHQRVIASVVYRKAAKVGGRVVAQELLKKGIEPEAMQTALAELKSTELARARAVWQKKFGQAAATAQEKAKQFRFMASRGFGADVLYKVIGQWDDDLDTSPGDPLE